MDLHCSICDVKYKNKDSYNDHLHRQKHKKGFTTQHTFWSGLKKSKPKIFDEMMKKFEQSNKRKT